MSSCGGMRAIMPAPSLTGPMTFQTCDSFLVFESNVFWKGPFLLPSSILVLLPTGVGRMEIWNLVSVYVDGIHCINTQLLIITSTCHLSDCCFDSPLPATPSLSLGWFLCPAPFSRDPHSTLQWNDNNG